MKKIILIVVLALMSIGVNAQINEIDKKVLNFVTVEYNRDKGYFYTYNEEDSTSSILLDIEKGKHFVKFFFKGGKIDYAFNDFMTESYKEAKDYYDLILYYGKDKYNVSRDDSDSCYDIGNNYSLHDIIKNDDNTYSVVVLDFYADNNTSFMIDKLIGKDVDDIYDSSDESYKEWLEKDERLRKLLDIE